MSCFVADQFQQLAHGSGDQQPPFKFRRPDGRAAGLLLGSKSELIDGAFHHLLGDLPGAGLLGGVLPGALALIRGEADQRTDLSLVLRLLLGTNRSQIEILRFFGVVMFCFLGCPVIQKPKGVSGLLDKVHKLGFWSFWTF